MIRLSYAQRQMLAARLHAQYCTITDFCSLHRFSTDTLAKILAGSSIRKMTLNRVLFILKIEQEDFYAPDLMTV